MARKKIPNSQTTTSVKPYDISVKATEEAKVCMSKTEFYKKLDASIASTASGPVYTMEETESGMDFINRMLSAGK